jgi:ABC-2 type transport system ATP-binding protein
MHNNNLEVRNLELQYPNNGFHLQPINFSVPAGSVVGLIGENGSGKTTTMNLILNLRTKTAGDVKIFNQSFENDDIKMKERIGVSFDELVLPTNLTVREVSTLYKRLYTSWDDAFFINTLAKFSIDANKQIAEYSRGMQRMFSIVLSMSHQPDLLILDEPTSTLDPVRRVEVLEMLQKFIAGGQRSILFSSHITTDIEQIADFVLYIHKGKRIFFEAMEILKIKYGIVRCLYVEFEQFFKQNPTVVAYKKDDEKCKILVKEQENAGSIPFDFVVERTSLEEIMNIVARGEVV